MKPLFIIGYMGCGKTTFGRTLSAVTGKRFIDLDDYIEARHDATVREIFAAKGEAGFREIERDLLHEVAAFDDTIVSCGGGTPCFFDNIDFMNSAGNTLWLKASDDTLFSRLIRKREKRPLLAGKSDDEVRETIDGQLRQRTPFYSKAAYEWQGDSLEDRRQIDENVSLFISRFSHLL